MNPTAPLHSIRILSPAALAEGGCTLADTYAFRGADGTRLVWPRGPHAPLGAVGAWNAFRRMGWPASWMGAAELSALPPATLVVVSANAPLPDETATALEQYRSRGGAVLCAGLSPHWMRWFGFTDTMRCADPYYAGVAARWTASPDSPGVPNATGATGAMGAPQLWAGEGTLAFGGFPAGVDHAGELLAVLGERQTPQRAMLHPLGAPLCSRTGNALFLNGNPFAAFQGWLQGQQDLTPWLGWRPRLLWLDHWCATLRDLLAAHGLPGLATPPGLPGMPPLTVLLRHDVDCSRDTSYLLETRRRGIASTYAVLDNADAPFWAQTLRDDPLTEHAFHYTTVQAGPLRTALDMARQVLGLPAPAVFSPRSVSGRGLMAQVMHAARKGIGVSTLHRHYPYLKYPEWVDALEYTLENAMKHTMNGNARIAGSASLFRGATLRWGNHAPEARENGVTVFPDVQHPLWMPFLVANGARGGRPLPGMESTHLMEPEPELALDVLDQGRRWAFRMWFWGWATTPPMQRSATARADGALTGSANF